MKHSDHTSSRHHAEPEKDLYYEPASTAVHSFEEKKSRFIAQLAPFPEASALKALLAELRTLHPDAAHVVHAYACGHPRPITEGCSDDGEPQGTAGRPVLDAIGYARLTNCIITVVRYFGGTKLGTGGLVRAYGDAARGAIASASLRPCVVRSTYEITVAYDLYERIRTACEDAGALIRGEAFGEAVTLSFEIEQKKADALSAALQDISAGRVMLSKE